MTKLNEVQLNSDLTLIETTTGNNGYPQNLMYAVTDFDTFEQAKEFANEFNGEVIEIKARAGQQLWNRGNRMFEGFHIGSDDYGSDYSEITYGEDWYNDDCSFKESLKELVEDCDLYTLAKKIEAISEIKNEFDNMSEDEKIILYQGEYRETIKTESTCWYDEGNSITYKIAVIQYN